MSTENPSPAAVITAEQLLEHWQGHRRLTRRIIEAFPEEELFRFSIGSMRTFGQMALELLTMAVPMVEGTVTGEWNNDMNRDPISKEEILRRWDESTERLNELWPRIPPEHFQETITAFGQYPGQVYYLLLYVIDNEIHHRAQGYVYLRALGVEPAPFYERD